MHALQPSQVGRFITSRKESILVGKTHVITKEVLSLSLHDCILCRLVVCGACGHAWQDDRSRHAAASWTAVTEMHGASLHRRHRFCGVVDVLWTQDAVRPAKAAALSRGVECFAFLCRRPACEKRCRAKACHRTARRCRARGGAGAARRLRYSDTPAAWLRLSAIRAGHFAFFAR